MSARSVVAMSSVITTRMFGRPSLPADGRARLARGRGQRRASAAGRSARHAARAFARHRRLLRDLSRLAEPYTVCHTVSTRPLTIRRCPMTPGARSARQTREESRERIVAAATELVRERSYAELSVDEVMRAAGLGRTIFYRHFDDLGDLLLRAGREAIEELYEAQRRLAATRDRREPAPRPCARRWSPPVAVYQRHGPLLRALAEAAAVGRADRRAATRRCASASTSSSSSRCAGSGRGRPARRRPTSPRPRARSTHERDLPARRLRPRAARLARGRGADPDRDLDALVLGTPAGNDRRLLAAAVDLRGRRARGAGGAADGQTGLGHPAGRAARGRGGPRRLRHRRARAPRAGRAVRAAPRHARRAARRRTPVEGWVERLDPETLAVAASTPRLPGGPFWPGGIAAHANGDLHMVFGRWAHRLSAGARRARLAPAAGRAPAQLVRRARRRRARDQGLRRARRARARRPSRCSTR